MTVQDPRCPSGLFTAARRAHDASRSDNNVTFRLEIHDIVANDTHGVVLVTSHGERGGQRLAVRAADIWHLAGGKATEHWSFAEDQAAFDKFFS